MRYPGVEIEDNFRIVRVIAEQVGLELLDSSVVSPRSLPILSPAALTRAAGLPRRCAPGTCNSVPGSAATKAFSRFAALSSPGCPRMGHRAGRHCGHCKATDSHIAYPSANGHSMIMRERPAPPSAAQAPLFGRGVLLPAALAIAATATGTALSLRTGLVDFDLATLQLGAV